MSNGNRIASSKKKKALELYREKEFDKAKSLYTRVCELDPIDAEAWFFLGLINSEIGLWEEAEQCFRKVAVLQPQRPEAHFNLGNILNQLERFPEAEATYREVLRLKPDFVPAHLNLGTVLQKQGRLEESLIEHRTAVRLAPALADGHFNMGNLLREMRNFQEAEAAYREALRLNPAFAEAYDNLGLALSEQYRFKEAVAAHREAVRIKPNFAQAYYNMGFALESRNLARGAIAVYSEAVRINPDYIKAWNRRAALMTIFGPLPEALVSYRRIQALDPNDNSAKIGEAWILEKQGEFEQAYSLLQPFLEMENPDVFAISVFAELCRPLGLCDNAINQIEGYLERKPLLDDSTRLDKDLHSDLHFKLGRLYDLKHVYDVAFKHYECGNEIYWQSPDQSFDMEEFVQIINALIQTYNSDFMMNAPRAKTASQRPVFIVGMPRSGTSLVEQILASHPAVYGAGELDEIDDIVRQLPAMLGGKTSYPACLADVEQRHVDQAANRYLDYIAKLSSNTQRVTDKMPSNFLHLGFINLLFPESRIIHCVRDPLDTCLSCYFQNFGRSLGFTQNLAVLGAYYRQYQRLMAHWASVLDIPMMEVEYEELIGNQEEISRQMIEFCGLEWDDQCLRFYDKKRLVSTASHDQVRQPIYKKSVARWKNYDPFIGPLKDALLQGSD